MSSSNQDIQKLLIQRLRRRIEELEKEIKKLNESAKNETAKNEAMIYLIKEELNEAWKSAERLTRELDEVRGQLRRRYRRK